MKRLVFLVSTFFCLNLNAQTVPEWENPRIFAINKEAPRATSIPYASSESAIQDKYDASPYYYALDGRWKFHWVPKVSEVPADFYKETFDAGGWEEMPVPGNWEFNGYGLPFYVSGEFGFKPTPPTIDREDSPVGSYRKEFNLPENWDGRRVFLHFEAGTNAMYVWVNGQAVGYTENSKSPAEFDITPYVRQGKNLLACQVHKYSDGYYLEDQDMWRLGGIIRSVYLYSTEQTRIIDFFADPDLDTDYKNGLFSIDIKLKNYTAEDKNRTVELALLDKSGKSVFKDSKSLLLPAGNTFDFALEGKINAPKKWTAETPHLYTLLLTLKDERNKAFEVLSHKIGFRKIEIKDGQLFINGKKVLFKGVNLHEFNYLTGQVVSEEVMMRNIRLMKELNINAVRTSHYPQSPLWYKLCDEYGLYLVDEANLESHGLGYGPDNVSNFPEWLDAHLHRLQCLIERDKNHASVIFWSLGNEASNGKAFFTLYEWAKARDKSRPVQYEQAHQKDPNTDIICPMYPSWANMTRDAAKDLGRPYIMCEYAHAMGNSMGNFQDYWDLIRSSKNMQGGFIWEWYNHGFKATDEQGRAYWAYGGDLKGYNYMNSDNFCMDGIVTPDQQYLPHTYIVKKVYQNILFEAKDLEQGVITVINDFKFTDLDEKDYTYKWVLLKNGQPIDEGSFAVSIPADEQKEVKLKLPKIKKEVGTEYYLQVFAYSKKSDKFIPANFEVAKEEFALTPNAFFSNPPVPDQINMEVKEEYGKATVKVDSVVYEFSTIGGKGLMSITCGGKPVFTTLPRLNFWRAPNDNEFGENAQYTLQLWNAAGYNLIYSYKGKEKRSGSISYFYEAKLRGIEAAVKLMFTVNPDGSLTTHAHYQALSDDMPEMMRFGMLMTLDKAYVHFTWYGRGPLENYVDRNRDAFMGIWYGKVQEQAYPYFRPQETGNKTDIRWLTLKNKNGQGIRIIGSQPLSVSATNNLPEDLDPGLTKKQQHASDIVPREETVLCVDLFQRGVGGLNSWGAKPLDKYRFQAKEYNYTYTIQIIR